MPDEAEKPIEKEAISTIKSALGKAVNPSLFLSLGLSIVNAYSQFQDMVKIQEIQKSQIIELQSDTESKTEALKNLVESTRERFKEDEKTLWEIKSALIALQTELQLREERGSVPRSRLNEARERTRDFVRRVDESPPATTEPLEGINF